MLYLRRRTQHFNSFFDDWSRIPNINTAPAPLMCLQLSAIESCSQRLNYRFLFGWRPWFLVQRSQYEQHVVLLSVSKVPIPTNENLTAFNAGALHFRLALARKQNLRVELLSSPMPAQSCIIRHKCNLGPF
ncbi:hypothetical protein ACKS0A_04260 [Histoplasma ohiense]